MFGNKILSHVVRVFLLYRECHLTIYSFERFFPPIICLISMFLTCLHASHPLGLLSTFLILLSSRAQVVLYQSKDTRKENERNLPEPSFFLMLISLPDLLIPRLVSPSQHETYVFQTNKAPMSFNSRVQQDVVLNDNVYLLFSCGF